MKRKLMIYLKKKEKKEKRIVFNEEIDDNISGVALIIAFVVMGIFLQFNSDFFGGGTNGVRITFITIGVIGLIVELSRIISKSKVKGIGDIGLGVFLLLISYTIHNFLSFFGVNIVVFLLSLISIFGLSKGLLEMIYSIYLISKNSKKKELYFNTVKVITQLLALVLVIIQIYDLINN